MYSNLMSSTVLTSTTLLFTSFSMISETVAPTTLLYSSLTSCSVILGTVAPTTLSRSAYAFRYHWTRVNQYHYSSSRLSPSSNWSTYTSHFSCLTKSSKYPNWLCFFHLVSLDLVSLDLLALRVFQLLFNESAKYDLNRSTRKTYRT